MRPHNLTHFVISSGIRDRNFTELTKCHHFFFDGTDIGSMSYLFRVLNENMCCILSIFILKPNIEHMIIILDHQTCKKETTKH